MKSLLVPLLLLSLAGNAALAFFVLRPTSAQTSGTAAASASASAARTAATATTAQPVAPVSWQTLKPGANLHTLVDNLRAAGFPASVIRAVAGQMITERLDTSAMDRLPFWKQNGNNPEFLAAQQQLSAQRRDMFNELLGTDARPSAMMDPSNRARRYGQLSDEKIDQIENLTRDYNELRSKLYAARKAGDTTGMMSAQLAAEQEQHAELATILSPAELEQYEMRSSQSASKLMSTLKGVEVSEVEYTALFRAQQAYDAADPFRAGVTTPDAMIQRNAVQDQLNEQARAVLTDDRFYEYLKSADNNYSRAAQFTANYPSVTPAMTYELTKIERDYQASNLARMRSGTSVSGEALMAARKDYVDRINALLGPEVGAAYAQRNRTGVVISRGTPGG